MSADRQMFKKSPPGSVDGFGGMDPLNSPLSEMETLRMFLNERLTAAVDDILGVFGRTVARYQEQIDCQKRQLEILRSGEDKRSGTPDPLQDSSWVKNCPEHQSLGDPVVQTDSLAETDDNTSVPQIKTEGSGEDCGGSAPHDDFDVAAHPEAEINGQLLIEDSDTEDSDDNFGNITRLWKTEETAESIDQVVFTEDSEDNFGNIARLWKTEETSESIDQISDMEAKSSANLWQETDQLPPMFSCKVCGESFHRMSYLFTHTSSHLRDCGVCGKHLERTESLKLHLSVHREASFRCSICGQSFTLRGNLRTHMRIHSGERPYACTVCNKSFGRKATLVRHVRSHTGEKPFTCTFCGHSFTEKGNLTVHLRTHTGEKPYWCSSCNRRFSQLSSFYKHPCQRRGSASAPVNPS